jgi:ribonuclease PH
VAAVSVGIVEGEPRLDLCYEEDRSAEVDANIVALYPDRYVEVQATGESAAFGGPQLDRLLELAQQGVTRLFAEQRRVLGR